MKTLFYGGMILTMAQPKTAEALLAEDGKIVSLGKKEALWNQADERVDLQGKTMMPGFIDPHSHFFQVATALLQVSLNGSKSAEEIGARISAFVRESGAAEGEWINARDYDNNLMPELKNPTLEQLDSYAPGHPLVIHHKSGHMGMMNSMALAAIGIDAGTPSPAGGRIETKDGKLTGYLEENAFFDALKKVPMPGVDRLLKSFEAAQDKYASYGITTLQDGMVVDQMLPMYELISQKKLLKLDVMLYPDVKTYDAAVALANRDESGHIKVGGIKIFLDGSPQGRTAWMRRPYEGSDDYSGYGTMTDAAVEDSFRFAARKNVQLIAHCNGDGAAEQFLRCLEKVEKEFPNLKELRPVIIHGQLIGRDQLQRAAKLGAMISFFIAHIYHWGDVHLKNFGAERADHISPARSALDAGVKITFHQDAPVIEPDMMETIWCAVNRISSAGRLMGEDERIGVEEALRAVTVSAAYQYSQEMTKGTLEAGKDADFVVLDRNPLETPAEQLRSVRAAATYKAGRKVYSKES